MEIYSNKFENLVLSINENGIDDNIDVDATDRKIEDFFEENTDSENVDFEYEQIKMNELFMDAFLANPEKFIVRNKIGADEIRKQIINKLFERSKNREIHPSGSTSHGKWYPSSLLDKSMGSVRSPSHRWPWSYMTHCRNKKFISKFVNDNNLETYEQAEKAYRS